MVDKRRLHSLHLEDYKILIWILKNSKNFLAFYQGFKKFMNISDIKNIKVWKMSFTTPNKEQLLTCIDDNC